MSGKWSSGLFDCCSPLGTCCLGHWAPCCLYGKTQARMDGEKDPGCCNGSCIAYGFLMWVGVACCLQCLKRGEMRKRYHIEGSACGDFWASCCCPCCELVQSDKESRVKMLGEAPGGGKKQYASPQGMDYR